VTLNKLSGKVFYRPTHTERSGAILERFLLFPPILKPFLDLPIRRIIDHLIPIALVLYDLLKGTDVIFCFCRRGLEMDSLANRLTHNFCLIRL
jgi:hypothetical protein